MSDGQRPLFGYEPARQRGARHPQRAQEAVQQPHIRVEHPAPQDRHRHAGDERRQIVDHAEDALEQDALVEHERDRQRDDRTQRHGHQGIDRRHLQRLEEQRILEQRDVLFGPTKTHFVSRSVEKKLRPSEKIIAPSVRTQEADDPG